MQAKKSLGQNFLKSESALKAMLSSGEVSAKDTVLEIGPGKGALTEKLLASGAQVIAIEKDRELIIYLKEKFNTYIQDKKLILIEGDALTIVVEKLPLPKKYKLIANIPYYITGAVIRRFLEHTHAPIHMVLLVQKEVALRIVARDKKESILSTAVQAYALPTYVTKVEKRYFTPMPKVDSAIVSFEDISKKQFQDVSEDFFFKVVHAGFAHKRKLLIKNLESVAPRTILTTLFEKIGLIPNIRAENVPVGVWFTLARELNSHI